MSDKRDAKPVNTEIDCPNCGEHKSFSYGEVTADGKPDGWIWSCPECDAFCETVELLAEFPDLKESLGDCASWVDWEYERLLKGRR